jgi:hypothetical protein
LTAATDIHLTRLLAHADAASTTLRSIPLGPAVHTTLLRQRWRNLVLLSAAARPQLLPLRACAGEAERFCSDGDSGGGDQCWPCCRNVSWITLRGSTAARLPFSSEPPLLVLQPPWELLEAFSTQWPPEEDGPLACDRPPPRQCATCISHAPRRGALPASDRRRWWIRRHSLLLLGRPRICAELYIV